MNAKHFAFDVIWIVQNLHSWIIICVTITYQKGTFTSKCKWNSTNRESSSRRLDYIIRKGCIPKIFQLKNLSVAFNGTHLHARSRYSIIVVSTCILNQGDCDDNEDKNEMRLWNPVKNLMEGVFLWHISVTVSSTSPRTPLIRNDLYVGSQSRYTLHIYFRLSGPIKWIGFGRWMTILTHVPS